MHAHRVMWEARDRIANVKLRPSKGVLVYGPRGTGKTTLVKAMSQEFDAVLFTVTADEVYRGGGGEGEALLRSVFRGAADEMRSVILLEVRLCIHVGMRACVRARAHTHTHA